MKRIITLSVFTLLCINGSAIAQDYYRGNTSVKADSLTYEISLFESVDDIKLQNVNNTLLRSEPYDTVEQRYFDYEEGAYLHYFPKVEIRRYLAPVLIPEYEDCYHGIWIDMAIDPSSSIVKEVKFILRCDKNGKLLSIPPTVFEELEMKLIGCRLDCKVKERFKNATYFLACWVVDFY